MSQGRPATGWAVKIALVAGFLWGTPAAIADQFHYHNIIVGDRALGLGGAYGAVSDDASGIYYNPAGMAFALNNDISGSANTYFNRTVTYKETVFDEDFVEESGSQVPSFFGGLQKLDKYVKGLVAGFATWTTDSDLKDQDDLIRNKVEGNIDIRRFHRTVNQRASTSYAGVGAGYRVLPNLGVGFGLAYFSVDELVQEYQDTIQSVDGGSIYTLLNQNIRQHLSAAGIQPILGIQYAIGGVLSMGLTVKPGVILTETLAFDSERRISAFSGSQLETLEAGEREASLATLQSIQERQESEDALGGWPLETRLSFAWFASTRLLWTLDLTYHAAVSNAGSFQPFEVCRNSDDQVISCSDPSSVGTIENKLYEREAVLNYATGLEYYVIPSLPLRLGIFTNFDARPEVDEATPDDATAAQTTKRSCSYADFYTKYCNQPDHIDYYGGSVFAAYVTPQSQISVGFIVQSGSGKAQKKGGHEVQDVEALATTFAFSATHNL